MRFSALALPVLLAGCLIRDYARGLSAFEGERWDTAAENFERALVDSDMKPEQLARAAGLLFEAYERLDRWDDARRALERGADVLLADYRILDMSPAERAKIPAPVLFRYHWRVGRGALIGLDKTLTAPLRAKKVEIAELHFRRGLEIQTTTQLGQLLRGELLAELLEALAAVGRRSGQDLAEAERIAAGVGGRAADLKARLEKLR